MAGMDITPEREKQVLFTTPYYDNSALFVGQQGKYTSVDQLKGKKVGVQNGTTHQKFIMDKHPEITTVPYDSYQIQFCVLVTVIWHGRDFRMLIHNVLVVC
ncbi:transporter substrate-binding domain-containing protein, partial [Pseudomonas aeruginosa]|uniref:transporter substrate-binding domain-containing protein n=1 Tax=Pseudomonas aeruginosa TaxID=287 RepID=UPI0031B6F148